MRLAGNIGRKNDAKNRHLRTIEQLCYVFATKTCIDNRKKNLLNSNISSRCSQNMLNVGALNLMAEIGLGIWGTPANFNMLRVLASLLQRSRSPDNQTLHDIWLSPGLVHYIYPREAIAGISYRHVSVRPSVRLFVCHKSVFY